MLLLRQKSSDFVGLAETTSSAEASWSLHVSFCFTLYTSLWTVYRYTMLIDAIITLGPLAFGPSNMIQLTALPFE